MQKTSDQHRHVPTGPLVKPACILDFQISFSGSRRLVDCFPRLLGTTASVNSHISSLQASEQAGAR